MEYQTYTSAVIVKPSKEPIFSEKATTIRIEDEAGGCFVEIEQQGGEGLGKIQVDRGEWELIRNAVETMFLVCDRINEECREA